MQLYQNDIPTVKSKLRTLPFVLILAIFLVCILGFTILYSATDCKFFLRAHKQVLYYIIFLPIGILLALVDVRYIYKYSYIFYFISCVILIIVEIAGYRVMGAKRWIGFSTLRIQPSELAKIAIILMLARYFHDINVYKLKKIQHSIVPLLLIAIPTGLIIKQPDLGTGIIMLLITASMFFTAGVTLQTFIITFIAGITSMPVIWSFLHNYQKKRIKVFLNPELDPLGSGYNIIQSKVAIGSGGFIGKGFAQGTQSHLNFLPEPQTDFIFSCLGEEFGFLGGFMLLTLYFIIICYSLVIAINARSIFNKLVTVGVASMLFWHVFINIAMVTGLLPVVGIPLPLISYGGTIIASTLTGIGLVMNSHVNQDVHNVKSYH
ncbi:rod shape-determining protein RodA [Orientia chuto str. Dubai]|uniref:Peptidoglycan glycosyltransferase MrdB n=1 Tax=Orientia chuto str. Dubai TaxID=1359168 RepID=A0A0F3ML28_9RICK|nr:rod shape-determining protein RodA [Candidatus Orientia mediorientalis]KJV56450.1 rod shape-determining protein RodA [Orientia chuto str. Dubai]